MGSEFDASIPLERLLRLRHPDELHITNVTTTAGVNTVPSTSARSSVASLSGSAAPLATTNPLLQTTLIPITTVTQPTTTFTSFVVSTISTNSTIPLESTTVTAATTPTLPAASSNTVSASSNSATDITMYSTADPVCVGHGLDSAAVGLLSAVIIPSAIGLILWLIFAFVRPRFRQVYGLREWFVQQELRPKALGSGFFSFLFPKVPLVPPVPDDVSNAGRSPSNDARLFPSDEELSQRSLWLALLIVLVWSVLGLAGGLPLYLIDLPCNSQLPSGSVTGYGGYSSLTDISLLRLLRVYDDRDKIDTVSTSSLQRRAPILDDNDPSRVRLRFIILTALVVILGVFPLLFKILREFNNLVAYRRRWLEVKCDGRDLAWLSVKTAPGFKNWGEKQFKDYLVKIGLSSTLGDTARRNANGARRNPTTRRREEEQPLTDDEFHNTEVDVQTLFSIGNTQRLALLIHERDEILENLEIAETKYISSFRVTTPDPSVLDFTLNLPPPTDNRPYISRPLPLAPPRRRSRRHLNRAYGSSSLAPTSFVAPSSYYKLRGVAGVSGGRLADDRHQSLAESFNSRIIGSRFMEVNRNSVAYGRLPLGSHVGVEKSGELGPIRDSGASWVEQIPNPQLYGPNYVEGYEDRVVDEMGAFIIPEQEEEEWVDLSSDRPDDFDTDYNGVPPASSGPSSFLRRPRPPPKDTIPAGRRETFPLRRDESPRDVETLAPPHLRLQPSQPFVRPLDGVGYDDLGDVYTEITQWRSRLKMINAEIADAQRESYNDIASGTGITGWLMVGRGLRHIPGVEMIEGRAKEDIRWDVLQHERTRLDAVVMGVVILIITVALAVSLTAAAGLAVAPAPDVANYLPFFRPLLNANKLAAGVALILAPAVAVTIFVGLGLTALNWVTRSYGSVSVSGNQLFSFKIVFFVLTAVGCLWLVAVGAVIFSLQSLSGGETITRSLANGSVYLSILCLTVIINVAIIFPAILLLQPSRLWHVLRAEKQAITPRQRFRAVYPRTYNPTYAIGACVLAIVFASTFSLIFPLIAPAVFVLVLLTLIAHRFLVGYVYARTHSQTGGLLQIWLLRRFGTLLSIQPILLGLVLMSRRLWIEGAILAGTGAFVLLFVEVYTSVKTRQPGRKSLSAITQNSLERFGSGADRYLEPETETVNGSTPPGTRTRGSMASVLEMMSVTLAVMPSSSTHRGPVPLQTESLDDLTATERAARTHPDAPPRLPPLPFTDHAEEMAGILYAPELIAPPPIIWLPNDSAGVARSEAVDLQKYHNLEVTLDVRAKEDVMPRRSSSSRRR